MIKCNANINKIQKTEKMSSKIVPTLPKRKILKNGDMKERCASVSDDIHHREDKVEPETCQTAEKTPTPVSLFKHKDPPKKKYGKKIKGLEKSNAVNGIAHVNYDSDSIDLDLLATYNAKTFHSAASGEAGTNTCALGKWARC